MANRTLAIWISSWLLAIALLAIYSARYDADASFQSKIDSASISGGERGHVLLLTAHPDDECMFFAPTLLALTRGRDAWVKRLDYLEDETHEPASADVYSLCLSSGDADGLGETRKRELQESLNVLGVKEGRRWVLDEPFHDNITVFWDAELIAKHFDESGMYSPTHDYPRLYRTGTLTTKILTFDDRGISSHPNHISLERGVRALLIDPPREDLRAFSLKTTALLPKYTGAGAALFAKFESTFCSFLPNNSFNQVSSILSIYRFLEELRIVNCSKYKGEESSHRAAFVSGLSEYTTALSAMRKHRSQLVWFRWLYVAFSRYMWVNEWEEITTAPHDIRPTPTIFSESGRKKDAFGGVVTIDPWIWAYNR